MSNVSLFIAGTIVTLFVAAAIAALIWSAILEARDEQERLASWQATPTPNHLGRPILESFDLPDAA